MFNQMMKLGMAFKKTRYFHMMRCGIGHKKKKNTNTMFNQMMTLGMACKKTRYFSHDETWYWSPKNI